LGHANGEFLLLIDADLINLNTKEIDRNLSNFLIKSNNLDMLIFRRMNDSLFSKIARNDILITGETIVSKSLLNKILSIDLADFELELAINYFVCKNKHRVVWCRSSAYNTNKYKKMSLDKAIEAEYNMMIDMLVINAGFLRFNFLKQLLFYLPKEL
jgi:hypothetical protein